MAGKLSLVCLLFAQGCMIGRSGDSHSAIDIKALPNKNEVTPLIIVGSGVAGLGAAIHAARSRVKTLVIRGNEPGGLLTKTTFIENWPGTKSILGRDLTDTMAAQAQELGGNLMTFVDDAADSIDFTQWPYTVHLQGGQALKAMTVIIATGAAPKTLGVAGEQEYWGRGVTTCAICDAPFYQDKEVVIVGGGDSAVEEALQLLQYASKVTILVRKDQMRASASSKERLKSIPAIQVRYGVEIESIEGNGEHVTGITLRNHATNTVEKMPIDGVFLAIGHTPNSQLVAKSLEVDEHGSIVVRGRTQMTSLPGVFAAGEVDDDEYRQADVEAAEGKKAAMDAVKFLYESGFSDEQTSNGAILSFDTAKGKGRFTEVTLMAEVKKLAATSDITALYFCDVSSPESMTLGDDVIAFAQQVEPRMAAAKVIVSAAPEVAKAFHVDIKKIPCLIFVDNGAVFMARYAGSWTDIELLKFLNAVLRKA